MAAQSNMGRETAPASSIWTAATRRRATPGSRPSSPIGPTCCSDEKADCASLINPPYERPPEEPFYANRDPQAGQPPREMLTHRRRLAQAALAAALAAWSAAPAGAQVAEQPIRVVFPFAAGGSGDALARLIADKMRVALNRPVIVENRTGAAGRIGVQAVKHAAADGTTLLLTPIAPMAVFQHVYAALEYDPFGDFEPLSQLGTFDFGLAVGGQFRHVRSRWFGWAILYRT